VDGDAEFQSHLDSCPACSALVADLRLIAAGAQELAEAEQPPARVWVNIANQLRAEGIIHDPGPVSVRPALLPSRPRRSIVWWLAPVAAAVLAAVSYQVAHKQQPFQTKVAVQPATQQPAQSVTASQTPQSTPAELASPATKHPQQLAQDRTPSSSKTARPADSKVEENRVAAEVSPPASAEDQRFLTEVSERTPGMRSTYENQLRAVNGEIRDTLEFVRRHPGDIDARQHLLEVYQQKAMLYQMALDRIQ